MDILALKNEFKTVCENNPMVYKIVDHGNYFVIFTKMLIDFEDSYLNLYLIFEDNGVCLSDSNEMYRIYDLCYDISSEMLEGFAKKLDLDYENYRFTKFVKPETFDYEFQKFEKLKEMIENLD